MVEILLEILADVFDNPLTWIALAVAIFFLLAVVEKLV
jgi:hypothetical protein